MKEIDKGIIQKVKDKLGVNTYNVLELFKSLRVVRASRHPDIYKDETAKRIAHEEFTSLNTLYTELNAFIQQCQASMTPILIDGSKDVVEFNYIREVDVKDAEIERLKQENSCLKYHIEQEKEVNAGLHKSMEELTKQRIESIHDEIRSIYSPRKAWSNIGLAAILVSLLATFPIVRDFLSQIGATSNTAMIVIQVLSLYTVFNWLRSWLVNKVVENMEYSILNDPCINERLNIKQINTKYYQEFGFYESDIVTCIKNRLIMPYQILLFGGCDKTIKILTEDIIIQLDRKNLIKSTEVDGLNKIFIVKKRPN